MHRIRPGSRENAIAPILALLIGTGLRRSEISDLTFEHIQQRDGRWALVDVRGKGNRVRTVPMPAWSKVAIDEWAAASGLGTGRVFRSLNDKQAIAREQLASTEHHGTGCAIRPADWLTYPGTARSSQDICQARAQRAGRARADSAEPRTRDHSHNGTVLRSAPRSAGCALRSLRMEIVFQCRAASTVCLSCRRALSTHHYASCSIRSHFSGKTFENHTAKEVSNASSLLLRRQRRYGLWTVVQYRIGL